MSRVHNRETVHAEECFRLPDEPRAVWTTVPQLIAESLKGDLVLGSYSPGSYNAEESTHEISFNVYKADWSTRSLGQFSLLL
jgi:hypothetical protein